ncbi:MAG: zinc-binding dehydrogenase [Acidobacteriota bacterium]
MKAALFYGPDQKLKIEQVPDPKIKPGEVLVRVAACGACHTDLHYIDHGVKTFKQPPMILGHEPSGIIEEVGSEVKEFKKGDRVLLPAVLTCGTCYFCRTGRENICQSMIMFGNHIDGAYAEYVAAPAKDIFHLPDELPLHESCIIADAISTPYHAVKNRAEVRPGDTVAIFGCGGIGMNAVQMAASTGATVIAVDVVDSKLELAKTLGASIVINAKQVDAAKEIRKLTGGGADIAMEAIGNPRTIEAAFSSLRKGGRLCVIGYSAESITLPASKIMFFEMEVTGSLGCRPVDYPKIIEMARMGKIKVEPLVTARFSLDAINEAFDTLRRGEGLRAIIVP